MNPLLPDHALQFFGPDQSPGSNWGGVPWELGTLINPGVQTLIQTPWGGKLAGFSGPVPAVIGSGTVDDDTDGPDGSLDIDPDWQDAVSLRWPDGSSPDARSFRGMVMHQVIEDCGGELGDFGLCCWGGVLHAVQYADMGPKRKFQEGFEKTLRDIGVIDPGQSSRHAAVVGNDVRDFCSLIFVGSAPKNIHGRPYAVPLDEIVSRTFALWCAFSGRTAPAQ